MQPNSSAISLVPQPRKIVSVPAVVKRVNRKLAHGGRQRIEIWHERDRVHCFLCDVTKIITLHGGAAIFGHYTLTHKVTDREEINLEEFARKIGALKDGEVLEGEIIDESGVIEEVS